MRIRRRLIFQNEALKKKKTIRIISLIVLLFTTFSDGFWILSVGSWQRGR